MTYSSYQPADDNGQNEETSIDINETTQNQLSENTPFEVDPYGGQSRGYTDENITPRGVEQEDWQANVDYFVGCRTLSEEIIDNLNEIEGDIQPGEGLVPRLPCTISEIGSRDEEQFLVTDFVTSQTGDYTRLGPSLPPDFSEQFPYLSLILEYGIENVNPPNPFAPGVKEYDVANVNTDAEGYAKPQFRFCECVNYAYKTGWDYVDYETKTPFKGQLGTNSMRIKTAPFGPPTTRNNEVNNPGRHQMQSERGFAWFRQKPRKFCYIAPEAESISIILGTDEWQSGPSQCDMTNDAAEYGAGIFSSPGGKNAFSNEYGFHIKYTTKYGGKIMLFSAGHSFNDSAVGGVEGQEYGVCGVSGWMAPLPDTCLGGVGQNYYANIGLKYVYAAYRFDASLKEILGLIQVFTQLAENAEEVEGAIDGSADGASRNGNIFVNGYNTGVWERAKEITFDLNDGTQASALTTLLEIITYSLPKNEGKADQDIDWNFDPDYLYKKFEVTGSLTLYDVYNYIFPRQNIPSRALDFIELDFDIDEYVEQATNWNIDGDKPHLDELEEKYEKYTFLGWAFGEKGAEGISLSEDEGDFLVTWKNGMSMRYSEYVDYYSGGWFDACVRSGGSCVAETKEAADGSVFINEYRCVKTISVAEPEEDADLGDEEQVTLMTFKLPKGQVASVSNVITDEEIFATFDIKDADVYNTFTNPDSDAHVSPMSTRGANRKYLSTDHEASQMTDWDFPHDLVCNVYPAIFSDAQPRWSDYENVVETTQSFKMKRKIIDEQGKERIIDEMQRVYNWWNSADDHEHGISIWCGKDKNSLISKDWELAYVMKGASKGGQSGTIDPALLLDRKKNPDIQVGRPARGVDRYRDYKYFRVTAFSNRRVIGKDENGKNIYAGEKIDVDNWPRGGKNVRVKIWPNTTGLKPNPEDFVDPLSGPAYWSSNVYEAGFDNLPELSDWAEFGPNISADTEYWGKPLKCLPVKGGKTYEFTRVTSGNVCDRFTAPDLNITWSHNERYPEIELITEDVIGNLTYEEYWKDIECDRAVLTRDMSKDCKVYARAPVNAKWVIFGAHNTQRDLYDFQKDGEPWVTMAEVPENKVNIRMISGPMYWSGNGMTQNDMMPPFNNGRWKEKLNTYSPHNSAIKVEPGKRYRLSRLPAPENTPYNVSVIQITDEKGLRPRMNTTFEMTHEENSNKDFWKTWYTKVGELPLERNFIEFDAVSEWVVFGAYGHARPLDDWSTDGEPCIFGLEEVKPIKGPDYYAGAPINLINNQLLGYPDFTETHWNNPLNPITEFDNQFGQKERLVRGETYDITIPKQIAGKKMSFVWGHRDSSLDPKPEIEEFPNLFADSQNTGFWPWAYYKRSRYEDGNLAEILPQNESEGALTYRVVSHGHQLYFGSHDFRLGYERTLESWEKGGEEFEVTIRKVSGIEKIEGPVYWAKAKPDVKDDLTGNIQDGDIHFESYWWFSPFNKWDISDYMTDNIPLMTKVENPEFNIVKPQKLEVNNEYFLYWDADTMQGKSRKLYSVWAQLADKPLNKSFVADVIKPGSEMSGKLKRLYYVPEGEVNPVPVVLDSNLHTMSMDDIKKFNGLFQTGDPDYVSGSIDPYANVKPGGVHGFSTLANKCVTDKYKVLHISSEIKKENNIDDDDVVNFIFGAYGTNDVGATEDTWSPYGKPADMKILRINRPMGCVYYGDVIGGTLTNNLAQENTYIDFVDNSEDSPWEKEFIDSRFDPGIVWEFEDGDGNRKSDAQATREDREMYLTMEDGKDWRRFRKGKTYKIRLNRGAWCQLTPISADEQMLNWTEADSIAAGNQSSDDILEQYTTVFRDETIKLYAPRTASETLEQIQEREVEITMDRDYLFFSGHSFDTQRSEKYQQPTDITCWSEKGQPALVTVTYVTNNVVGPVYYAGDKSVTWAYEYSLPDDGGTGTTAGSTPQDPSDYGIIDFMNPHWRNSPWNVWKPDIKLERNKCYEISIIDFDLINKDQTVVQPGDKKPQWQDKFSMWFLHKLVNPEIKDINRAFYLEPSSTIEGNEGNLPNPGEDNILEPEYIILDGNSNYNARWTAMFRCITENIVFGVHRDAGSYVSGYGQPERSDGTTPDIGRVEDFNKAGVPGYFWIREVPDPDAETPTGVAYWAQSNNQKEIEWGNDHWTQPLNTVAPGRISQGKWYKITAEPDMDRNNKYRIWWSNDDTGRDGKHPGNVYRYTRYGVNEKNPTEPFDVISFNKEVIVYAEGQHMFFAAYNTTRNKIEDWYPDGEPAPVKVVEVDPPLDYIQGSVYYSNKERNDIWDGLPDFHDEHWAKINTYQEISHTYPTGPNDKDEARLNKFFLKDEYVYRFHKVKPYGQLDSDEAWPYNSALLYDCALWGINDRKGIQAGPENSMRHDKLVDVPASQPIVDLKYANNRYYMWSAQADNKKIEDWSPFGHPFLAEIEELGHRDDVPYGTAYWCQDNLTELPPLHSNYWLRPFNTIEVKSGDRLRLKIDDIMKGAGTYQPIFFDEADKMRYDDGNWEGKIKTEADKVIFDADEKKGVKEAEIVVPEGVNCMIFANRGRYDKMEKHSPDGEPVLFEIEIIPPPEGPVYFADGEKDNIPDYKNNHWEYIAPVEYNFKKDHSYRFIQIEEDRLEFDHTIIGHYGNAALEVGEKHGGRLEKLASWPQSKMYVDVKKIDTLYLTLGSVNAQAKTGKKLEDWSKRGEPIQMIIEDGGELYQSGPGYWSSSDDKQPYAISYNDPHWLTPLNHWEPTTAASPESGGTARKLVKGNKYKITAKDTMQGCVKLWFTDDEDAFIAPGIDITKFTDGTTDGKGGTIIEYADNNRFPRETTFIAKGKYLIFAVFNTNRVLDDWSRDGEPVNVIIDEVEDDDTLFGPVYWNDRAPGYDYNIFRNEHWKKVNHVPVSAVAEFVGKRASIRQKFLTEDRNYDLDVWFAMKGKDQFDDPKSPEWGADDWVKAGTWLAASPTVEIETVLSEYMVFTTRKVDDREDNTITGWSRNGEPLQVELDEVEFEEGPMYWADYPPGDPKEKGYVDLSDSYWKGINLYALPGFGTYKAKLSEPRKAPYDIILWEAKADQPPAYYQKKSNWTKRAKWTKGSSRDRVMDVGEQKSVYILGAYNTQRTKKDWSPHGEYIKVTFEAENEDVWGQNLFGHSNAKKPGLPYPLHGQGYYTRPDFEDSANKVGGPGKYKDGFMRKAFNSTQTEDGESKSNELAGMMMHKLKLKRNSGKWKLKPHTYLSVWGVSDQMCDIAEGSSDKNMVAEWDWTYFGDIGIPSTKPLPTNNLPGSFTTRKGSKTGGNNNSGGGGGSGSGGDGDGSDDGGKGRKHPGSKLEFRNWSAQDWLLFGQYFAPDHFDFATWPIHGKPLKYDLMITVDLQLHGWKRLVQAIINLLTKIPNILSLMQELDVIIEQNERQAFDEMNFSHNGTKPMSEYCRWTDASPKYFNTTCDATNRVLLRLLKLRYNGLFIHANSEKPNSTSNNSDKWKGMQIMNLTPTFQHGSLRMYNPNTRRALRYYGLDIPRIEGSWGRQHEVFYKLDTRTDKVREKSSWDDRLAWFNPQIGWGITQFYQHYYKVRHGKQYRSGALRASFGGTWDNETSNGNTLDNIFTDEGVMMKAIGWNSANDREKCATFEIMAGADTVWPLNCDERGISLDEDNPSQRPFGFSPGIEFTFSYGKFSTKPYTNDFQILDIYLYFMDPETQKVTAYKMTPEKSSKYMFRDTQEPESNSSVKTHKMAQRANQNFTIRCWNNSRIRGDQIFYKMTTTIYLGTANSKDTAHAMLWSELRPLATDAGSVGNEYLIRNVSDLNEALSKDYPNFPNEIPTDPEP